MGGSDELEEVIVQVHWTDGEYVPRHGCENLAKNKISAEVTYHDKRCDQGKARPYPSIVLFCLATTRKEEQTGYDTESYGKVFPGNIIA